MRLLCLFCVLSIPCVATWQNLMPNTLTPRQIAEGWILLFDGETTFGWEIDGEAAVENGSLVLGGTKATTAKTTTYFPAQQCSWHFRTAWEGGTAPSCEIPGDVKLTLNEQSRGVNAYVTQRMDQKYNSPVGVPAPMSGHWSFTVPAGTKLRLQDVRLRHESLKPIFNGKDLTGWKTFPARKSQFTVTPEGWLSLKDGPGDLQSVDQWGDFFLQLECISNGNRLNSGVFFRCRPDEYQNGYEAQIHNGFQTEPKEYTLDEYDPKTNELTGKKKVKYNAIDYGTGAIYRRIPARKEVAKDREWFTMTVAAQGRHFAVWVNGMQVTDWIDNRPPRDNARNGYRQEKGPISLQGHDPTTDLNFRNIRVAEIHK